MKTVVVFDTEDPDGMEATVKIMNYLAQTYLDRRLYAVDAVSYRKIAFIKMLRSYGKLIESGEKSSSLRDTKEFADQIFADYRDGVFTKPF